jgi:hypothetical protein
MLDRRQVGWESWQEVSPTWSSDASSKLPPLRDWHEKGLPNKDLREWSDKRKMNPHWMIKIPRAIDM